MQVATLCKFPHVILAVGHLLEILRYMYILQSCKQVFMYNYFLLTTYRIQIWRPVRALRTASSQPTPR